MTDLRQALRTAVETPPPDELDLVAVVATGRRARVRRRRWRVAAIAATTAAVTIAGVSLVGVVTRDGPDSAPPPANPGRSIRPDRALDPVAPPRDFVADPVLDFEPDAPLLREGDVVLGEYESGTIAYLTEDLQVLTSRRRGGGQQYGLFDPADPGTVDWLPVSPVDADELLPLCGYLVGHRGDCVQGARTLWFYAWVEPSAGISDEIEIVRFDRLTREWSEGVRPPRSTRVDPPVSARVLDADRLVIDGPQGRHVVPLDRKPICDRQQDLLLAQPPYHDGPTTQVEGELVVLQYYCSVLFDPGRGQWGIAVFDARGRMVMRPPKEGGSVSYAVVDHRFVVYHGMLVDLVGGRVYRLLRKEPHNVGAAGFKSSSAWVSSVRAGLVLWWENPSSNPYHDKTLHLTPLPGG